MVCEQKAGNYKNDDIRYARSNGYIVDTTVVKLFNSWAAALKPFLDWLEADRNKLGKIPLGSGIEISSKDIGHLISIEKETKMLQEINDYYGIKFESAQDRLNTLSQLAPIVELNATMSSLASILMKLANDVRFLSSGPRSGIGELTIPENEPGSSIMPGKVNPTQCESMTMVASQVIGNHNAITIANSLALFESNSFKPLIANNTLRNLTLLIDSLKSFRLNCAVGMSYIEKKIEENRNIRI